MKRKLLSLLVISLVFMVIAGAVQAQPETDLVQPPGLQAGPILAPNKLPNGEMLVAPAALTATRRIEPAAVNKKGKPDQHTAQASQARLRQVYAETEPTSTQPAIYIVQLADAPLASYRGGLPNLSPTSPRVTGVQQLDVRSGPSVAYRTYLGGKQASFRQAAENELGRSLKVIYQYDVTFNGLALQLTPQEAAKLLQIEGVLSIQRDQWRYPQTSDSPAFLGVTGIWDGSAGAGTTKGEGVIVGVIDSGIWPEHPSFADDGSYPAPPVKWSGGCQPPADDSLPYTCNNKLIGVQYFLEGYAAFGYDGLFFSGRDDDGHGTHTASTAAGNENVPVTLYGINRGTISGMAPRAHVAAYKGLGPTGGVTSDLVAAIDKAVADGVDVINYSVGSDFAGDPWVDADSLAYLAARDAGVFVATSAGNAGPGVSTIGSPANAPWLTTVGASYFNRLFLSDITLTVDSTVVMSLYGTTITPGVTDFRLVDAEGVPDILGDTSGACVNPFPPGTFLATDAVLCPRGGVGTWVKGNFVSDGGAGAVVIYNDETNFDLMSYLHAIPTVYIYRKDGLAIKEYLADNPGQTVNITFTQGERVFEPDPRVPTDLVVGFSSRGPNINENESKLINVIKPDVTAPGLNILAGASPDYITVEDNYTGQFGAQGELFQLIQGTSMSSPHVAGLGALMKALHPNWTPAEIQSALMTTAFNQGLKARLNETTDLPVTPFDLGSGRTVITQAAQAGFVLDETVDNYLNVDPFFGGDPATLNIASLTQADCLISCSWSRTLRSTINTPVTWNVSVTGLDGLPVTVSPSSFVLPARGVKTINITANVSGLPFNEWRFAEVRFTPETGATARITPPPDSIPTAHFPVAVRPVAGVAPFTQVTIETRRNQGQHIVSGLQSIGTNSLTTAIYVGTPDFALESLAVDPTNGDPYDDLSQVFYTLINVSPGTKRFVAEVVASTAPDLDMYVGLDTNGNNQPDAAEELCASAGGSFTEICNFPAIGETLQPGNYWVLVQNWAGSGAPTDDFILSTVLVDGSPTSLMAVSGPPSVAPGAAFDLVVSWNVPGFQPGDSLYGIIEVGTGPGSPSNIASIPVTLLRLEDDVTKTIGAEVAAPGETVDFTLSIVPEPVPLNPVQYTLTDTLPAGLTYVPGSATIAPTSVNGNQLVWVVDVSQERQYRMSTNLDDPLCDTGFGGYVNLEDFGIFTSADINGNNQIYRFDDFFGGTDPVNFFGIEYPEGLYFTDNGFATLASPPVNSGDNRDIPRPAAPNSLVAPFWRDLAVVYNEANNRGVSIAAAGGGRFMILEYDDVEPAPAGSTGTRYDFEIVMDRQIDDTPGFYEIVFAYDNINGPTTPATIGIENETGTEGVKYAFNNAGPLEDLIICFNYTSQLDIDYQVTVDPTVTPGSILTNNVVHAIASPGTGLGQVSASIAITGTSPLTGPKYFPIIISGPFGASQGGTETDTK